MSSIFSLINRDFLSSDNGITFKRGVPVMGYKIRELIKKDGWEAYSLELKRKNPRVTVLASSIEYIIYSHFLRSIVSSRNASRHPEFKIYTQHWIAASAHMELDKRTEKFLIKKYGSLKDDEPLMIPRGESCWNR